MKVSTTFPILLLPLTLAHTHGVGVAPGRHGRRSNNSLRNVNSRSENRHNIMERQHSAGLLGGLMGEDSTSAVISSTTATAAKSTITPPTTSATTTSATTSKNKDVDDDDDDKDNNTTTAATSHLTTTALTGQTTSLPAGSPSIVSSGAVSGSIVASSTIAQASANLTTTANSTSVVTATSSESSSSTPESSAASIQYTTDAAGQTQLVTVFLTASASAEQSTNSATSSAKPKDDGDSIPTPAIIGISVGVGVVVIALIAFAVWRMKRRTSDEDEAIRWPELNRHGDSDAHHALPARQTGQHGFETNPLSRSLSNSSSIFAPPPSSNVHPNMGGGSQVMALNGSSFGATSSLEDDYNEKLSIGDHEQDLGYGGGGNQQHQFQNSNEVNSHDDHDNYTSLPPPLQHYSPHLGSNINDLVEDDDNDNNNHIGQEPYGGLTNQNQNQMSMINDNQHVTLPNPQVRPNFRLD
ncbi:uncharacterized protein L201_005542 [Kwoniella dendrophila CBS 6074]|uniref:Mid2 domain-containing protein n=1 Tax=Kwoniella dendrophila CBS 6074 TaxID=1295534 RepID=A0AAX4JZE0_9TREE